MRNLCGRVTARTWVGGVTRKKNGVAFSWSTSGYRDETVDKYAFSLFQHHQLELMEVSVACFPQCCVGLGYANLSGVRGLP